MIGLSHTPVVRTPDPAWLLAQLATLTRWLTESGHRWPAARTAAALRAIHAGDRRWVERAAEVKR